METTATPSTDSNISEVEEQLGIKTYLSKHKGFRAIFKKRYSDFIVHEVDTDGRIAKLEKKKVDDTSLSTASTRTKEEEEEKTKEELKTIIKSDDDDGEKVASEVMTMIKNPTEERHSFIFAEGTKEERRSLHEFIRENAYISTIAIADTIDSCVRIWSRKHHTNKKSNRYKDKGWPRDRPPITKFVLYKENMDTMTATKDVFRILSPQHHHKTKIDFAGMKDKRGITTQYCTVFKKTAEELEMVNKKFASKYRSTVCKVGNVEYVHDNLKLGALSGNRFDIALRNVQSTPSSSNATTTVNRKVIKESVSSFQTNGFINYFGTQRFGKYHDTCTIGIQVLKHNFQNVVDFILEPKIYQEHNADILKARLKWKERFNALDKDNKDKDASKQERASIEQKVAKEIMPCFGRFMISEVAVLQSIIRSPCDYQNAFLNIPRGTKLMFVHAVQSFLWNALATKRAQFGFNKVIVGDLVLTEDKGKEDGGSGTSGLLGKEVEYVTEDNIQMFKISDVVLPLIGMKVKYPEYDQYSPKLPTMEELLRDTCSGLRIQDFNQDDIRELKLGGDYRKFIVIPKDVQYQLKEYADELQPLIISDAMRLNEEKLATDVKTIDKDLDGDVALDEKKKLCMSISFTLPPSAYATIAIREVMKCPTSSDFQIRLENEDKKVDEKEKVGMKKEDEEKMDTTTEEDKKRLAGNGNIDDEARSKKLKVENAK